MEKLIFKPHIGVGIIKFGMTKDEVRECIEYYEDNYYRKEHGRNYFKDIFRVEYDDNNKVNFIEVPYIAKSIFLCTYNEIDLFNTKVIDLISSLKKIANYDKSDPELGYSYNFTKLGMILWRPSILTEEDIEKEWFKELSKENQKDELRRLYFESIALYF